MTLAGIAGAAFVSESFRYKLKRGGIVAVNAVKGLVIRGNSREVRAVSEYNFDDVVNSPGRLVIVFFHDDLATGARDRSVALNKEMDDLPAKVLLAKVHKGGNESLIKRLGIKNLPAAQIYKEGVLLKNYTSGVDGAQIGKDAKYLLKQ